MNSVAKTDMSTSSIDQSCIDLKTPVNSFKARFLREIESFSKTDEQALHFKT